MILSLDSRKNKTMLEVLNNITLGLSMASNITLLRSSASLHAGHQENNDSLTPPLDTPARAMMDVTQNAPTSPQRVILQRPITRTYPSKRGNKQKVYTPPGNPSSTTYGKGASVSRPGSPYRTSSEARDVDTPIGINEFLNGFRGVNEEENTEVADDRSYELLQARKDCQGTPEKLGDSKGVSSAIVNDEVRPQSIKVPLSPVNGAKQKRYPGMLLSPERSIRGTS